MRGKWIKDRERMKEKYLSVYSVLNTLLISISDLTKAKTLNSKTLEFHLLYMIMYVHKILSHPLRTVVVCSSQGRSSTL